MSPVRHHMMQCQIYQSDIRSIISFHQIFTQMVNSWICIMVIFICVISKYRIRQFRTFSICIYFVFRIISAFFQSLKKSRVYFINFLTKDFLKYLDSPFLAVQSSSFTACNPPFLRSLCTFK